MVPLSSSLAVLLGIALTLPHLSHSFSPSPKSCSWSRLQSAVHDRNNFKTVSGPPIETKPDYESIHGPLGEIMDKLFMSVFRIQMAKHVGVDSKLPKDDYTGLMELVGAMNARYSDRKEVQAIAQDILRKSIA